MNNFKIGDIFYLQKGLSNQPLYKCHVVAIADKEMVVYRWYGRHKQWWHYEVEHYDHLNTLIELHKNKKEKNDKNNN